MYLLYQDGELLSISGENLVLIVGQVVIGLWIQVLALASIIIENSIAIIEEWPFEVVTGLICTAEFRGDVQDSVSHFDFQS
jgi:hypothetical protein